MSQDTVVLLVVIAALGTVVGGLILDAIRHSPGLVIRWARKRLDKFGITQWIAENTTYVRDGFRFKAVFDYYNSSRTACIVICKKIPPQPDHSFRSDVLKSGFLQSRKMFAWQLYATLIPTNVLGNRTWKIYGWSSPEVIYPGAKVWTIEVEDNKLLLAPGWTPIPPISEKRRAKVFIPPSRYSS